MKAFNGIGYGEIRNPSKLGLLSVLVETDFHDNPKTAQWIFDNKEKLRSISENCKWGIKK